MELAQKLERILLKVQVRTGENGKIFGGVSSKEIAENLNKDYKYVVDKKKIDLKEPIKELGTKTVDIKLYEGVIAHLKVDVIGVSK